MREQGICSYSKCSKTFYKRNYKHHACCPSHRTLSNREKNGSNPNPYKPKSNIKKNISKAAIAAAIPSIMGQSNNADVINNVGAAVITNAAIPSVMEGIQNGKIKPIPSGAGAVGGYFISGYFTKNPLLRILAALIGGYTANEYYNFVSHEVAPNAPLMNVIGEISEGKTYAPNEYAEIINSREYRKIDIPTIKMKQSYFNLFGNPSENFYMMVHGLPGQGKSHWAVKFADYFNKNHGSVLYYAAEQNGISKSFQMIQQKLKTSFDVHTSPEKLDKMKMFEHLSKYKLIVIDSVNAMNLTHEEVKAAKDFSNCAILVILQSNKDGDFKGAQNWMHDVDISIKIDKRIPLVEKSRFGGGEQSKFETKVVNL